MRPAEKQVSIVAIIVSRAILLFAVFGFQSSSLMAGQNENVEKNAGKVDIRPLKTGQEDFGPVLTLKDASKVALGNMIPRSLSGESGQDSEPFLAVHPDRHLMVGSAYTWDTGSSERSALYLSTDGGWNWILNPAILPAKISGQSFSFSGEGKTLYGAVERFGAEGSDSLSISILKKEDPMGSLPMRIISVLGGKGADQPFIQVRGFTQKKPTDMGHRKGQVCFWVFV